MHCVGEMLSVVVLNFKVSACTVTNGLLGLKILAF